jgi:hypothetical protein
LKLFLNVDTSITLVQGQGTYVLSPTGDVVMTKPLRVIQSYFMDSRGVRRPLVSLSWDDYIRLSQVNQQGSINSYFVNKQATYLSVFFWLLPDATAITGSCHVLLQVAVTAPLTLTETTSFPDEWRRCLVWALADQLASGQPQSIMDRCQGKAEFYRRSLEDWDVEDAVTQFQPDSRMQYSGSNFR